MATTSTAAPQPIDTRYRRIISIAVPVMLANLAMPLQSLIDTAVVGNMNAAANLAGMGLAIQLLSLLLVSFNFLQYASSGLSAQALGRFPLFPCTSGPCAGASVFRTWVLSICNLPEFVNLD